MKDDKLLELIQARTEALRRKNVADDDFYATDLALSQYLSKNYVDGLKIGKIMWGGLPA